MLIASFLGFQNDTIKIDNTIKEITFLLKSDLELSEVVVYERRSGQYISSINPIYTQHITSEGLEKLPCCNLAESFENNASVDVAFTDAVSGAKQITMLGLAGVYTQLLIENMPSTGGLATNYGLAFVPGPWMESIQISKGTASVLNGYESTTGQINVELKKPKESEKFYFNTFANDEGRVETNINTKIKINPNLATMFLLHASTLQTIKDMNQDSFLDIPLTTQLNFVNRWEFEIAKMIEGKIGVKILDEKREGGQVEYIKNKENIGNKLYGIDIKTRRYEFFSKIGFLIPNTKMSIGTIFGANIHNQNSLYGKNIYNAHENNIYANIIFQAIIVNTNHKINAGTSYMLNDFYEELNNNSYLKKELVPGIFAQYTYNYLEKFNLILGYRLDFNSKYGTFATPRLHTKYNITKKTTIRASAGKGYRTANILAENIAIMGIFHKFKKVVLTFSKK